MDVNITINASPELIEAIKTISNALVSAGIIMAEAKGVTTHLAPAHMPELHIQAPAYTAAPAPIAPPIQMQAPVQAPPATVPTATQTYSMEQLAVAATQLMDAGRRTDLIRLLNSFGVQALTDLPKEQYGAFATQLRAMGAKI